MNLTWGPRWLLIRRVAKVLLWAMLLLAAAVLINIVDIHFLGSVVGWERWLVETSGFFLLWRLCLYGATVCGWVWMRRRLLARESGMEARRRLLRAEVAGVVGIVALEASLLMQAT